METIIMSILLLLVRAYLIYWMYQGISEVVKFGNKMWTGAYLLAIVICMVFTSMSTFHKDLNNPKLIVAVLASSVIVTVLVKALRIRSGG